jgi:hypothetical protein
MADSIRDTIPASQLKRLDFLLGDLVGVETMYPPGLSPIQFRANFSGSREVCERFLNVDFFGNIPNVGVETFRAMITYSERLACYRMWIYSASQEEPVYLVGDFEGSRLTFVSEPTPMMWGMQRLRFSLEPLGDGSVDLLGERWELEGFVTYCSAILSRVSSIES